MLETLCAQIIAFTVSPEEAHDYGIRLNEEYSERSAKLETSKQIGNDGYRDAELERIYRLAAR